MQNAERLDSEIIYNRDFDYDYFGFKVRYEGPAVALDCLSLDALALMSAPWWCADSGKVLPAAHKWHSSGEAPAHAHARSNWYTQAGA
jgi:hypothetical protein